MLARVVFVPSAPLVVPQLAGPRATDTAAVRDAVRSAGSALAEFAPDWVAIGAADIPGTRLATRGSFAPYGVDVGVSLRAHDRADGDVHDEGDGRRGLATSPGETDAAGLAGRLPLSMLIAAWVREAAGADRVEPLTIDPDETPDRCLHVGRTLAAELAATDRPVGVLVVGDGSTQLSPSAPGGGLVQESVTLNDQLVAAIGAGDRDLLAGLSAEACDRAGVGGRAAWQVAAGLGDGLPITAHLDYAGAPFGVGYVVASWTPGTRTSLT
ncbi:hypothetical protein [Gordonia sp. (in: high G+C Gram-positive bacteria)]|uniref:hypothetical protein n=1 Tax=Gordonia sp. (in: high G+C Gram-positive bacteria) TaxID=84139 RepID=UPI002634B700|nr:hypothetical protein [Gordonia sp. (in: high G+C Gram-positive bacteria)]HMS76828.1 hypothetical protein [Gordonia sp. (in: high G+C Gram-positive bacteria)]